MVTKTQPAPLKGEDPKTKKEAEEVSKKVEEDAQPAAETTAPEEDTPVAAEESPKEEKAVKPAKEPEEAAPAEETPLGDEFLVLGEGYLKYHGVRYIGGSQVTIFEPEVADTLLEQGVIARVV